jgi:hypothetical protein
LSEDLALPIGQARAPGEVAEHSLDEIKMEPEDVGDVLDGAAGRQPAQDPGRVLLGP